MITCFSFRHTLSSQPFLMAQTVLLGRKRQVRPHDQHHISPVIKCLLFLSVAQSWKSITALFICFFFFSVTVHVDGTLWIVQANVLFHPQ